MHLTLIIISNANKKENHKDCREGIVTDSNGADRYAKGVRQNTKKKKRKDFPDQTVNYGIDHSK